MAAPKDDEGVTQEQREAARRIILGLRDAVTRLQRRIEQGRREPKEGG